MRDRCLQLADDVGDVPEPQPRRELDLEELSCAPLRAARGVGRPIRRRRPPEARPRGTAATSTHTGPRHRGRRRPRAAPTRWPRHPMRRSRRRRTGSTASAYPPSRLSITDGSPNARRSMATFDCSVLRRVLRPPADHKSSTSRSAPTGAPASSARRTTSSEVFPPGTGTRWPSRVTSRGPSTATLSTRRAYARPRQDRRQVAVRGSSAPTTTVSACPLTSRSCSSG